MSLSLWQVLVLAVVQGLTEFLPVSSTAHLRLVPALLGWKEDPGAAFTAVIQLGTLLSLLIYFRHDILTIARAWFSETLRFRFAASPAGRLGWMMIVATVPIVVCGLLFKKQIEHDLRSLYVVAAALMALAVVLAFAEVLAARAQKAGRPGRTLAEVTWFDCLLIGCCQAVALIPGSSRSGTTLTGGLFAGLDRATAARFSFLLSIPAVFAAAVLMLVDERKSLFATSQDTTNLIVCTLISAVVGYAAIHWLLEFLKRYSTWIFIVYRMALGILLLALLANNAIPPLPPADHEPAVETVGR